MLDWFISLFIKNSEDVKDPKVRGQYGIFAGIFGILCNLLLAGIKLCLGLLIHSVSVIGDAVNNLSDAVSSIVTLAGFKLSGKNADREHPYGHGRFEYLSGLMVAAAVVAVAVELLITSVKHIISPAELDVRPVSIVILILSILVKLIMSAVYFKISKKISSRAMQATAMDSLQDCVTTTVALVSVVVMLFFHVNIDGYAGAVVAVFVIVSGLGSLKDTVQLLLGEGPDEDVVREIEEITKAHKEILGVHDLRIHDYGPGRTFASMHVEIPYTVSLIDAHEIIDAIEQEVVSKKLVSEMSIHVDPVVLDDEEMLMLREKTGEILRSICENADLHDFRLIRGRKCSRLIFDVLVPYSFAAKDEELKEKIEKELHALRPDLEMCITIDRG